VSGAAQAGTHLGPVVQDGKDAFGGSPNPANDNGGGND
jgi:hypothetical protein